MGSITSFRAQRIKRGIEHADDFCDSLLTMVWFFLSHSTGTVTLRCSVDRRGDKADTEIHVDRRISGCTRKTVIKCPAVFQHHGFTTETEINGSSPLSLRMITYGAPTGRRVKHRDDNDLSLGKTAYASGARSAIGSEPVTNAEAER